MSYKRTVWQDGITPVSANNLNNLEEGVLQAAPLESPTLTGTPKASTPPVTDNSERLATTSFVKAQGYVFEQMVPSDVWTIMHNLNKSPSVTIVDSAGSIVIGDVRYVSLNEIEVTFNGAFSGKAYLN